MITIEQDGYADLEIEYGKYGVRFLQDDSWGDEMEINIDAENIPRLITELKKIYDNNTPVEGREGE